MVKRKTQSKRLTRKLKALREEMRRRWHASRPQQHTWLCQVLRGHYQYYGVIFNSRSLYAFYEGVKRAWFQALGRQSQKANMTWKRFHRLLEIFPLPKPTIHQAWHSVKA